MCVVPQAKVITARRGRFASGGNCTFDLASFISARRKPFEGCQREGAGDGQGGQKTATVVTQVPEGQFSAGQANAPGLADSASRYPQGACGLAPAACTAGSYGCRGDGGCPAVDTAGCAVDTAAISAASIAAILAWAATLKWIWSH